MCIKKVNSSLSVKHRSIRHPESGLQKQMPFSVPLLIHSLLSRFSGCVSCMKHCSYGTLREYILPKLEISWVNIVITKAIQNEIPRLAVFVALFLVCFLFGCLVVWVFFFCFWLVGCFCYSGELIAV